MPKFGNLTCPAVDVLKEIEAIGKLGFDFAEIGIEGPEGEPKILLKNKSKILKLLEKYNMFAVGHTSWYAELGSNFEPVRKSWIKYFKECINAASKLGIEILNLHSHSRGMYLAKEKHKKLILKNYIKSLKELVKYAKTKNIKIMLENSADKGEIVEFKDIKYIMDRIPALYLHLDIGHANVHGGLNIILKYIRTFSKKLLHIHILDDHGKKDEHLPLGKGNLNYKKVMKELKKINYDKTITFEIFTENRRGLKSSLNKLKKLC